MGTVVLIVLICLLIFNLVGLYAFLQVNVDVRRKLNYVKGTLERTKSLVAQKNAAIKRQQVEINRLTESKAELEKDNLFLKGNATDLRRRYVAMQQAYEDLQSRHGVMEKTLAEKAVRLATIEQHLREIGAEPPQNLKAV